MEQYTPVNDEFREELEVLAVLKKVCLIKFKGDNDVVTTIRTQIAGTVTEGSMEYVKTGSGLMIRMDKLIEVDGKSPENMC